MAKISKLFSSAKPTAPVPDRRTELVKRDAACLARQLELEAGGVTANANPGRAEIEARAQELAGGDAGAPAAQTPGAELVALYAERAALKRAIELIDKQEFDVRLATQRAAIEAAKPAWRDLIRQRANAVLALQKIDTACMALRAELNGPGGLPSLACGGFVLPRSTNQSKPFIAAALAAGFISESELTKWH